MSSAQMRHYRTLWAKVVEAQNWDKEPFEKQEQRRRAILLEVTGKTSSKQVEDNGKITQLFVRLEMLADAENLNKVLANQKDQSEENKRKQLIWRIENSPLGRAYVDAIVKDYITGAQSRTLLNLPVAILEKIRFTVAARESKKGLKPPGAPEKGLGTMWMEGMRKSAARIGARAELVTSGNPF